MRILSPSSSHAKLLALRRLRNNDGRNPDRADNSYAAIVSNANAKGTT
jgi:hypothetical protein